MKTNNNMLPTLAPKNYIQQEIYEPQMSPGTVGAEFQGFKNYLHAQN